MAKKEPLWCDTNLAGTMTTACAPTSATALNRVSTKLVPSYLPTSIRVGRTSQTHSHELRDGCERCEEENDDNTESNS